MKKIFSTLIAIFAVSILSAQVPQGFSYQAVVRDNANAIVANSNINVTISILKGASADNASAVYSETHSVTTNANGLFTIVIGDGESAQSFSAIDWSNGNYYVKTESSYGTSISQLLSVPFAMYAAQSGNANIDLSAYALKSDIPSDLSSFTNNANFLTSTQVAEQYLTKEAFEAYILSAGDPESVDLTVYAKTSDLDAYAKKTDIPTNVSKLTNDAGYLTQHQSLSAYAKTSDLSVYAKTSDLNSYAKKSDLSSYAKTTDIPSSLSQLTADKIGDMPLATVQVNITNYDNYVSVDFLGKTLTSGTSTYKIPAYSPVYITVNKQSSSPDPQYRYLLSVTINGVKYSRVAGYCYAPTVKYWDPEGSGDYSQTLDPDLGLTVYQKFEKISVYKDDGTDIDANGQPTYKGIINQIIGPFSSTTTNTINITVTKELLHN